MKKWTYHHYELCALFVFRCGRWCGYRYTTRIKRAEKDLKELVKKVNDMCGASRRMRRLRRVSSTRPFVYALHLLFVCTLCSFRNVSRQACATYMGEANVYAVPFRWWV